MALDTSHITFFTVDDVTSSWYALHQMPDCDKLVAETMFRKIIELAYSEKKPSSDVKDHSDSTALFRIKSAMFVQMLDSVINMLGPDLVPMVAALLELGAKHCDYGVTPEDYALVKKAFLFTLSTYLGSKWTPSIEESWKAVFGFISTAMIKGAEQEMMTRTTGKGERLLLEPM